MATYRFPRPFPFLLWFSLVFPFSFSSHLPILYLPINNNIFLSYGSTLDSVSTLAAGHFYLFLLLYSRNIRYYHNETPSNHIRLLTFIASVGFYTRSLALVADAFHYV